MSQTLKDIGYYGITSLCGVKHRDGMPLILWSSQYSSTTSAVVANVNPNRKYLQITNEGTQNVKIAYSSSFSDGYHTLIPKASLLIDTNNPWCGEVWAEPEAGTGTLSYNEASIQQ